MICQLTSVFLTETWDDTDSVTFRRLSAEGFQVIDRPRPCTYIATLATTAAELW